jgi:hypothetical protein
MFGVWRLLGRMVKINTDQTWFITDETAGRLIYEEYSPDVGKSSDKSRFYELKYSKLHPRKETDGLEVLGLIEVNLSDAEMAKELTEE